MRPTSEFLAELQTELERIVELGALHVDINLYAPEPPPAGPPRLCWDFYIKEEERGTVRYARKAHYASNPLSWKLAASSLLGDLAVVIYSLMPGPYEFRGLAHQAMLDGIYTYMQGLPCHEDKTG